MDIKLALNKLLDLGLTQTELADKLGCSQTSISLRASGAKPSVRPSFKMVDGLNKLIKKHKIKLENSNE